jgi:hypothetical protein
MRPFRFGYQVRAATADELRQEARSAEEAGFDVLCTFDHLGQNFSALAPLLAAAAWTTRIRLCPLVLNNHRGCGGCDDAGETVVVMALPPSSGGFELSMMRCRVRSELTGPGDIARPLVGRSMPWHERFGLARSASVW